MMLSCPITAGKWSGEFMHNVSVCCLVVEKRDNSKLHLPSALLSVAAPSAVLPAESAVLACRSMGPHKGGFLPKGDSCDDCLLTRLGSGSVSLAGGRVGRLVATGPTEYWGDGQREQPEGGHSRDPVGVAADLYDVRQLSTRQTMTNWRGQLMRVRWACGLVYTVLGLAARMSWAAADLAQAQFERFLMCFLRAVVPDTVLICMMALSWVITFWIGGTQCLSDIGKLVIYACCCPIRITHRCHARQKRVQ